MQWLATVDESYSNTSDYLVLGGYVGSYSGWDAFTIEWLCLLAQYEVEGFHATDVRGGRGWFADMRIDERIRFIEEAEVVANRHLLFRYFVGINIKDYKSIYADGLKGVHVESAYGMCFRATLPTLDEIVRHLTGHAPAPLDIMVESGHKNSRDLTRIFGEFKALVRPPMASPLGTLSFGGKTDVRLHAADAMAYAGFRDLEMYGAEWSNTALPYLEPPSPDDTCPVLRAMVTAETLRDYRERVLQARADRKAFGRRKGTA